MPPRPESNLPERTLDYPNSLGSGKNKGAQPGRIEPPTLPTPLSVERRPLISTSATAGPEAGQRPIQAPAQVPALPAMRIEEEENENEDEDDDEDDDDDDDEDEEEKSVRGAPFYEYFKSRMISFIFVLIIAVAYFAFGGSRVLFDMISTHGSSNHRCASISLAGAAVEHLGGMFAPTDDPNAGLLRQSVFCSSASQHSSKEAAPSCLYSSDAMTAMAVNDSKYGNESIGLFGFERSEVPELLREGCGCGKFQGHYIVAPRCGLQAQEGKVSDLECLFIYCVVRKREERFFKVTSFLFFLELMLIGLGYPFFLFSFFCNLCYTIFLAGKASTAR